MKIQREFLRSRVARRVFTLFVISSLAPVALLSALSFNQLDSVLTDQRFELIRQSNKSYGVALLDRLLMLDAQLQWLTQELAPSGGPAGQTDRRPSLDKTVRGFKGLQVLASTELGDGSSPQLRKARDLIASEAEYLATQKGILVSLPHPRLASRLFLLRLLERSGRGPVYILAEIDPGFLFGDVETFSRETQTCVLDEGAQPLFCSQSYLPLSDEQRERLARSSSGHFLSETEDGARHLVSYWSIFLKPNFWVDDWTVVTRMDSSIALVPVTRFRLIFAGVIALTLAIIALMSVHRIRRTMIPLEKIVEGVKRIGQRDFTHPVQVETGDELEELAVSVNQMAGTIDKQFQTLSTMAEIDRLILSSLKAEDIVGVILTRTSDMIRHDHICMAVLREQGESRCYTLSHGPARREGITVTPLRLHPEEAESLGRCEYRVGALAQSPSTPSYLETLAARGARQSLTLPIRVQDALSAVISLGYEQETALDEDDIRSARDFANRVAVALSNAKWEEQLYHLAHYDTLTGLPNRLLLKDRLSQALATAERQKSFVAVLFIDLDRFKNVNDSLGHVTGDYLLREVGTRLAGVLREEDTVSRIGGDEFVILIQQFKNLHESLAITSAIAQKILQALTEPFHLNDREIVSTASIGIACYPTDGETSSELLKNADAAMYHAKARGKDNYQYYSKILNAEAIERLELENALRSALERGELHLAYQPKIDTKTKRISGAEALLRWTHPQRGRISPAEFIPLCEEIGLIIPIGEWVLRQACLQVRRWLDQGMEPVPVAVNLSPVQFRQPDLTPMILRILSETGVDPELLELEITEGAAMENVSSTITTLGDFKRHGLSLSIDDFGTGHSSLSYIKQFPIDTLKVDQSFVRHIRQNPKDDAIVKSIVTLAHSLGCRVVAEGVETQEQLDYLAELGCDLIQGYYFSPPVAADAFTTMLRSGG